MREYWCTEKKKFCSELHPFPFCCFSWHKIFSTEWIRVKEVAAQAEAEASPTTTPAKVQTRWNIISKFLLGKLSLFAKVVACESLFFYYILWHCLSSHANGDDRQAWLWCPSSCFSCCALLSIALAETRRSYTDLWLLLWWGRVGWWLQGLRGTATLHTTHNQALRTGRSILYHDGLILYHDGLILYHDGSLHYVAC